METGNVVNISSSNPLDNGNFVNNGTTLLNANEIGKLEPGLISSKRKRKRKNKKVCSSGTEENALISEKQTESPNSQSPSIINKHNGEAALSLAEKDNTNKNRKRRNRKKQNTSGMERDCLLSERKSDKKLLVLDVNGLLVHIVPCSEHERELNADMVVSDKSVFRRPFCDDFLQFCFEKFNVGVWCSSLERDVDKVVDFLMAGSRHKLLFCWDLSQCTNSRFTTLENSSKPLVMKRLEKLWEKLEPGLPWNKGDYDASNTLLLDDSPYKALRNPDNTAIFPKSYSYKDAGDCSLGPGGNLRVYLEKLAEAPNVQKYVARNPFGKEFGGQEAIGRKNPNWIFYRKVKKGLKRCRPYKERWKKSRSASPSKTGKL